MTEPVPAFALDSEVALRGLLLRLGVREQTPPGVAQGQQPASAFVLQQLGNHGVHARLARVSLDELHHLELPTLVRLKGERWLLAVRRRGRAILAEDARGCTHAIRPEALAESFDGGALDRIAELPAGNKPLSRVRRIVWAQRRTVFTIMAFALLAQGFSLITPQLARALVDRAFPEAAPDLLWAIVLGMVLVALFQSWIDWLERSLAQHLQTRLDAILERGLLVHVLRLPYRYIEKKTLAQLMQAYEGIATARDLVTGQALTAVLSGVTALAFLVLMARLMAAPTAAVAGIGVLTLTIVVAVARGQKGLSRRYVASLVRERGYAAEVLTHVTMIKAAGAEQRMVGRWFDELRRERALGLLGERIALTSDVGIDLLGHVQIQGLWVWGGLHVLDGTLQLGELVAFTLMASAFHAALAGLGRTLVTVQALQPHLRETAKLLGEKAVPRLPPSPMLLAPAAIEIRDLWFRYRDDLPWVFSGLNLVVNAGELCRLEGRSGFGKTTLLKLVAGLYEPQRGSIRIGGYAPHEARDFMIYLPQFVQLFNTSLMENLRIFSGGTSRAPLLAAAEHTGLANLVKGLPMGYDTLLAQGGENFSGGQRQLIALTGVLASQKRVLLLDEAMANLDSRYRATLTQNPCFQNRTILYASHDTDRLTV